MIRNLWPLLIGFTTWAVAFLALYSLQALGCVWNWDAAWHRTLLIAIVVVTLMVLAVVLIGHLAVHKSGPSPMRAAGVALTLASIAAAGLTFSPVLFVAICT